MLWSDLLQVFLLALAGSGHCLGMCSAFGLAVSAGAGNARVLLLRHVAYQLGKGTSYAFLGVVLLLVTSWAASEWPLLQLQRWIALLVGMVMILTGVLLLTERRLPQRWMRWWDGSAACGAIGALWQSPSLLKSVLIGWVNGFLPCGLSLVALLFLTRNGSTLGTALGAYVFTFGTLPALLLVGWIGQRFGARSRRWWVRVSGLVMIVFGLLTLVRDQPGVHGLFHPLMPELPGGAGHSHPAPGP